MITDKENLIWIRDKNMKKYIDKSEVLVQEKQNCLSDYLKDSFLKSLIYENAIKQANK